MTHGTDNLTRPGYESKPNPKFPHAPNDWSHEDAEKLARTEGLTLTEDHWEIVRGLQELYARSEESVLRSIGRKADGIVADSSAFGLGMTSVSALLVGILNASSRPLTPARARASAALSASAGVASVMTAARARWRWPARAVDRLPERSPAARCRPRA